MGELRVFSLIRPQLSVRCDGILTRKPSVQARHPLARSVFVFTTHLSQSQLQGLLCCLSLVHSDLDITHLVSGHIVIEMSVISSAILISQGETYTKYLGRICTGTSMSIAVLTTVAAPTGFEPAISSVTDWRGRPLPYGAIYAVAEFY